MITLGIETSCDETAVALYHSSKGIISNIVSSQIKDHAPYGGVVPEIAARKHLENIQIVFEKALNVAQVKTSDIDLVSVTSKPGLMGALLVGVNFAKGLAYGLKKPIIPVNHLKAHVFSIFLDEKITVENVSFPFLALVISGGHTSLYRIKSVEDFEVVAQTLDDAIGEAYDKVAKICKLGYPGGPIIEKLAREGKYNYFKFPKLMANKSQINFSFSGLKTAALQLLKNNSPLSDEEICHLCAGFQTSAVDLLIRKTFTIMKKEKIKKLAIVGGVSANGYLRNKFKEEGENINAEIMFPLMPYTTDNAAMVACLGYHLFNISPLAKWDIDEVKVLATKRRGDRY